MTDNGTSTIEETQELAQRHFERGKLEKAQSLYETILETEPENCIALDKLGVICVYRKDLDSARSYFESVLTLDESHKQSWNHLGNVFLELGETDKAIEHYQRAVALDEGYTNAYHNLAVAYRKQGKIEAFVTTMKNSNSLRGLSFGKGLLKQRR